MSAAVWPEARLGELMRVTHGYAFKGEFFENGGAFRVVTPGNFLEGGGFRDRGASQKSYHGRIPENFVLPPGALVVAMTEQAPGLLGSSALIPDDSMTWLHNQRIGLVQPHDEATSTAFLYHLFNTPEVRNQISATATGTKIRHTAPERIAAVQVRIPSPALQHSIGATLSAFDDLIAINERRIELFEDLARSLYREWFVRLRFPGYETARTQADELPSGWRETRLGDTTAIVMGQSPRSEFYNARGEGLPFHQGVSDYGALVPVHRKFSTHGSRVAQEGDLLLSVRAPVGRLNMADRKLILGRGVAALRRRDDAMAFQFEQVRDIMGAENSIGGGTIYHAVNKAELASLPSVEPERAVINTFERVARPMLDSRFKLTAVNRRLADTRDLLLPRLVSGRLDISEIDLGDLLAAEAA